MEMKAQRSKTFGMYEKSYSKMYFHTSLGCMKKAILIREFYSNTGLHHGERRLSNKQPRLTPKKVKEKEQTKLKNCRKKERKIRAEMNEIETKKEITIEQIQ